MELKANFDWSIDSLDNNTFINIEFTNKTIKIKREITHTLKFDEQGNAKDRTTVIGNTKTACSVRNIPITDIVLETLKQWKEKQSKRQETNPCNNNLNCL